MKRQSKDRLPEESCSLSHESKDGLQDAGLPSSGQDIQQCDGAALEAADGAPCRPVGTGAAAALDSLESGGCPSNTHPHSSQFALDGFPEYLAAGGLDWFEWTAFVWWHQDRFAQFIELLESKKRILQEGSDSSMIVELEGLGSITLRRTGRNRGKQRGQHFEYQLSYDGIPIAIANRPVATESLPNVWLQLTGTTCLLLGPEEGYIKSRAFIEALGGVITKEILSRVDLTIDISGLHVGVLQNLAEAGYFVCRASEVVPYTNLKTGEQTGLRAGHSPLYMTIYDKLRAHIGKTDRLYLQGLIDRRWGGIIPEAATRIEFQVGRTWLREHGISSPHDFLLNSGAVAHKLTHNWFRLTERPVDRANKNHSRAGIHPVWAAAQQAFALVYCEPTAELVPINREAVDPLQLIKQGRGCLKNAILQQGHVPQDYDEFIALAAEQMRQAGGTEVEQQEFIRTLRHLATEYQCSSKGRAA